MAKAIGKNFRSTRSILAIENLKSLKPSPLTSPNILQNIIPGNFDDDFSVVADADWVIEAVIERLDIKKSLHKRISEVVKPNVPVTTNTSGIPLAKICEDLNEFYQKTFFGTHFFNPPRYMNLLEIIPHAGSDEKLVHDLAHWISERLGKGIVYAKDTINFIANRIGVLSMQATMKHLADFKINFETVDALTGPLIGHPKSATMRTMDVVGLDTFAHVAKNVLDTQKNDPFYDYFKAPAWLAKLIEKGHLGQKTGAKGGAYRKEGKDILVYRPETETYVAQDPKTYPWVAEAEKIKDTFSRLKFIFSQKDDGAEFIWRVHRDIFSYSALLLEEIAHGLPLALDDAMRWGFNWEWGPFQLWQGVGFDDILARMKKDGAKLPAWAKPGLEFYTPAPTSIQWQITGPQKQLKMPQAKPVEVEKKSYQYFLPKFQNKEDRRVVASNKSASLVDLGDGIACLTFHSKMNTLNDDIIELTQKAVATTQEHFNGLVIGNEGDNFSAGAYLVSFVELIEKKDFKKIDEVIRAFQGTMQLIKFAPFPSVSCPHGLTLGGGCEISLHATRQLLANDTFAGLVEMGVGLIPAGGGTKELALRCYDTMSVSENGDPMSFLSRAFLLIGMGRVSTSGMEAIEMGLYPKTAQVSISKEHQIDRAKGMIKQMLSLGYAAPLPRLNIKAVGDPGIQTFKLMLYNMVEAKQISAYDAFIGEKVATVLCGGAVDAGTIVTEQYLLELERRAFVDLCREEKTKERIVGMLKTGKPVRN
jgi:3-hydroxyacyl-CoA dehydrogenase